MVTGAALRAAEGRRRPRSARSGAG